MRLVIWSVAALIGIVSGFCSEGVKPNIILFMADDMGMGDTSAYQDFTGNTDAEQVSTPQMDRLARIGVRFTDAHTPSSRCTTTRYGLLTGRYVWRSRLQYFVLFGEQGDPLIEPGRPTIASILKGSGYRTAMFGKWHLGLRYRKADGSPAAAFVDADLTKGLHSGPLDCGFDIAHFTSRSHATSGPGSKGKPNGPEQNGGPGHITDDIIIGATGEGRAIEESGPNAYVLEDLGERHSDNAIDFLRNHTAEFPDQPFFLYYPSNSNHGPYTPSASIGGVNVAGQGKSMSGEPMGERYDYIYENDVALGRLLDYLAETEDPRNPGQPMLANTMVIFTSDNGAEIKAKTATGPFRSNKGSCYEGGHRVPFLVSWPAGGVGDGLDESPGQSVSTPIGLIDVYATFAELNEVPVSDYLSGEIGGEDSRSMLAVMAGETSQRQWPLFFNDHKEANEDPNLLVMRWDDPVIGGETVQGHWKGFFEPSLVRLGGGDLIELYDLLTDPKEQRNRVDEPELAALRAFLEAKAHRSRRVGSVHVDESDLGNRVVYDWRGDRGREVVDGEDLKSGLRVRVESSTGEPLTLNSRGLGVSGGDFGQVENGEAMLISFEEDVLIESVTVVAGNGNCGGFVTVGDRSPLAIYCIDEARDSRDQSGRLSDLGVLRAGQQLRLDSSPHFGAEPPGRWRIAGVTAWPLKPEQE